MTGILIVILVSVLTGCDGTPLSAQESGAEMEELRIQAEDGDMLAQSRLMSWSLAKCQDIGKRMTAYCRARAIEVRQCHTNDERFGVVNSYPVTAWEDFLGKMKCHAY